ncbi:MAG: EVE domain-containing protein [Phycisphaerales bacterium]|nr:EVE domain-containing protein [Planctomycetota bacterium]
MQTFLLKTEPGTYSYSDLEREGRTRWTGITNPAALKALRAARKGDAAFIYHTGNEKAIVGIATIVKGAYPDPEKPGVTVAGETKFPVIDLAPARKAAKPLSLAEIRADERFADLPLLRQSRLSAMILPPKEAELIRKLTRL